MINGFLYISIYMNFNLRNQKTILFSLLFLIVSSCQNTKMYSRLLRVSYSGISEKKRVEYLVKNKIDTLNTYFANDSFFIKVFEPKFKSDSSLSANHFRPVQFRVFDSAGNHVNTWANCYGPLSFFAKDVGDLLIRKSKNNLILNTNISDYLKLMKGNPVIEVSKYDIIIIAYWQWFMVDYSLNMLKELQALPNIKNKKIVLIKLNMD